VMDGQTTHNGVGSACIASHGKNHDFWPVSRFISLMIQYRAIVTVECQ